MKRKLCWAFCDYIFLIYSVQKVAMVASKLVQQTAWTTLEKFSRSVTVVLLISKG